MARMLMCLLGVCSWTLPRRLAAYPRLARDHSARNLTSPAKSSGGATRNMTVTSGKTSVHNYV